MPWESEAAELWRLFRESRAQIDALGAYLKETAVRQEERNADYERRSAEQERQAAELRQRLDAVGAFLRESGERQEKRHAEMEAAFDRRQKEQQRERQKEMSDLRKLVADTNRQVGNLTGKWGRFVEEIMKPATETIFQPWGVPVHDRMRERKRERGGETMEFDIIVANDDAVVAIEVKSTLGADDVRTMLKQLPRFKTFFPEYRSYRVFGAVGGIVIADDADRFAANEGLFVLRPSGETVAVANKPGFEPRQW